MIVPLISVLLLLLAGSGHLANIDTSQPIVFEYPFPLSHSPLFGYSVLALGNNQSVLNFHLFSAKLTSVFFLSRFIIGAPNASLAEKFSRIQSTGAIFRCIVDLSQQTSTCRTIEISGKIHHRGLALKIISWFFRSSKSIVDQRYAAG